MIEVKFPVFADKQGNRFVFPGLYSSSDGATVSWGYCRQIEVALGVAEEKERLCVPVEDGMLNFPHVKAEAGSRGFMHGSGEVYLIGGPEYDRVAAEQAPQ